MNLTDILIFAAIAPFFMAWVPTEYRSWGLFILSLAGIGWLQYQSSPSYAAFVLVGLTVLLTVWVWWIIQPLRIEDDPVRGDDDRLTAGLLAVAGIVGWVLLDEQQAHFAGVYVVALLAIFFVGGAITPKTLAAPEMGEETTAIDESADEALINFPRGAILAILGALIFWYMSVSLADFDGVQPTLNLLMGSAGLGVAAFMVLRLFPSRAASVDAFRNLASITIIVIVVILIGLKIPAVTTFLGDWFPIAEGESISPLAWLGFSYVSFRLISLLRDFHYGRLPDAGYSLRDVITYVLFFPAYTAGPIDQAQRFIPDLQEQRAFDANQLMAGGTRIAVGIFKKFVVADSLALLSMSGTLTDRTETVAGLWLLVYIYAFQIYFDFSGYSDVAIGLGKLYGITLPENFDRPYLQPNIQQFWNRWHMTLTMWFRSYYFSPLSRALIRRKRKFPSDVNVLIAQVSTMLLIGLWHGVALNFVLWGVWHGVGLFAYKLIADRTRRWHRQVTKRLVVKRLLYGLSVLLTFHFVAVGWALFALPDARDGVEMIVRLFGGG